MIYTRWLENAGYIVLAAEDGISALELALEHCPDLVILDCIMPGLNGFEVLASIRQAPELVDTMIIMVTSITDPNAKMRGLHGGADEYLTKPLERLEFLARVQSLMRIKQLNNQLALTNSLLHTILRRYLAPDLISIILNSPMEDALSIGGKLCTVSVIFADICRFTSFSETRSPAEVANALNRIFDVLVPIIFKNRGTFDKYLGDAVMAFYGAPNPYPDDALRAVTTAVEMQEAFAKLVKTDSDLAELGLGIGVVTGEALVGNLGSQQVIDYTVIGDTPNTCKRVQEHASAGQILICPQTLQQVQNHVEVKALPQLQLKHRVKPLKVFLVTKLHA